MRGTPLSERQRRPAHPSARWCAVDAWRSTTAGTGHEFLGIVEEARYRAMGERTALKVLVKP
ncbi:hypothetical protein OHA79_13775 [Streptomyces sp. NBC_00841]|uniref:hypothetical protein n=1 Tax=unclassified Streptomyces TaxID=2593676 RepID=UPI00225801C8|nr:MULTISPECIES: hypothetical protein [unclassified Streptomyces]MCX4535925.1 hypothetical protein [Streptomyces sp. NBC_01669]WRZ98806.1 hypothetical protein OHA79_13775 [Streptomyces sp. NBC_00841]